MKHAAVLSIAIICIIASAGARADQIIYVDAGATGSNNGSSWQDAHIHLQDALAQAMSAAKPVEIWVSSGSYTPDSSKANPNGTGSRDASFVLISGIRLYGGFPAGGGTWEQRDPNVHETALTGDLAANDGADIRVADLLDHPSRGENSYRVVRIDNTDETTLIDGFTITGGNASDAYPNSRGGGVYGYGDFGTRGGASIYRCDIRSNAGRDTGGGIFACGGVISYCVISGNSGAGLTGCWGPISNCVISGNWIPEYGAGLDNCRGPISHCTIVGNMGGGAGGGFLSCDGFVSNCIIWANRQNSSPEATWSSVPVFSCVEGDCTGIGCIDADPKFVAVGYWDANETPDDVHDDFWVEGNYRLRSDSPCIDSGNLSYAMQLPSTDVDGNTRLTGQQIDMGCFEFAADRDTDGDWLADMAEPLHAANPDRDNDGIPDGIEFLRNTDPNTPDPPVQWNVPADLPGIQQALFFSRAGEMVVVSEGTYYENLSFGGRNITLTGTDPNDPAVVAATIINGDTDRDRLTTSGRVVTMEGSEDQTCRIRGMTITGGSSRWGAGVYGGDSHASISNCVITGNAADWAGGGLSHCGGAVNNCTIVGNTAYQVGGGICDCDGSVTGCTISSNASRYGAGAYTCGASIVDCTVADNRALIAGGGLAYCAFIKGCTIADNVAGSAGGGIYSRNGTITDCVISRNTAGMSGGGLADHDGQITGCTISGNRADSEGGGLSRCDGVIKNSVITGNRTLYDGAGLYFCRATISSCTISDNVAGAGGGGLAYCRGPIRNCIIWSNHQIDGSELPDALFSCVQGGWPGISNIDVDPCFVAPGCWVDANDLDTPVDPHDPRAFWVDGDYHLKSEGWRWDAPRERWTYDSTTSPCIDAGDPAVPLGDEPLTLPQDPNNAYGRNLRMNMGAYGGTAEASIPPHDWAIHSDYSNDGIVNSTDFACWSYALRPGTMISADLDRNGITDPDDLTILSEDWLKQTSWFTGPRPMDPLPRQSSGGSAR